MRGETASLCFRPSLHAKDEHRRTQHSRVGSQAGSKLGTKKYAMDSAQSQLVTRRTRQLKQYCTVLMECEDESVLLECGTESRYETDVECEMRTCPWEVNARNPALQPQRVKPMPKVLALSLCINALMLCTSASTGQAKPICSSASRQASTSACFASAVNLGNGAS